MALCPPPAELSESPFPLADPQPYEPFPGLPATTPPLKVTGSKGNPVNELESRNPIAFLVCAITESGLVGKAGKYDAFYLGAPRDGALSQIHHIISGAPSRGTMALESERALPGEGSSVQSKDPANPPHATEPS